MSRLLHITLSRQYCRMPSSGNKFSSYQCCWSNYIEFGSGFGSRIFGPIWIRIQVRIRGYVFNFERKQFKNHFREIGYRRTGTIFFSLYGRGIYFLNCKKIMVPVQKELYCPLSLWMNFFLKSYTFCFYFILYFHVWIRIRIHTALEYRQKTVPDTQHWFL